MVENCGGLGAESAAKPIHIPKNSRGGGTGWPRGAAILGTLRTASWGAGDSAQLEAAWEGLLELI